VPPAGRLVVNPLLSELATALETKDMKEINAMLEAIEKLPLDTETREKINTLSDHILMAEYAEALETANALLGAEQ
jgi:hypothetical protein